MWNVRSLYRAGSLTAAARELARYKLNLVGVQNFRWDKRGTLRAGDYNIFYGKGKKIVNWEQDFFCTPQNNVSRVKRVEFASYRLSYIVLRGRWCNIIFMNVRAPSKEKSDDSKDSFYEDRAGFFIFLSAI